jgi:hypothetical protein
MKRALLPLAFFLAASALAGVTTNNDDSCDIALQPAATLLLPYFEVDFQSPQTAATQTLFTIQNTSSLPQIARVTLWTDWGFPAYSFPVFLGGYDVQGFNLYDLFAAGTVVTTSIDGSAPENPTFGSQPALNGANPNFLADVANSCRDIPAPLAQPLLDELRRMFTTGATTSGCTIGGTHANAIGYATIDVVATCAARNPTSPGYFSILLYDNVLTGDYQQLVPRGGRSYAQGSALVHIRAIPEGGPAGTVVATSLPYTFYDRYTVAQPSRTMDRRQPLPSVFAPRFIAGGPGALNTMLKIWREGVSTSNASCSDYKNNQLQMGEAVRFDEQENATVFEVCQFCQRPDATPLTMAISATHGTLLPPIATAGDAGGWLYLNVDNGGSANYSAARPGYGQRGRASQAWVITSMFAEPTYATETAAIALGNGCSPRAGITAQSQIGPAPNPTP